MEAISRASILALALMLLALATPLAAATIEPPSGVPDAMGTCREILNKTAWELDRLKEQVTPICVSLFEEMPVYPCGAPGLPEAEEIAIAAPDF